MSKFGGLYIEKNGSMRETGGENPGKYEKAPPHSESSCKAINHVGMKRWLAIGLPQPGMEGSRSCVNWTTNATLPCVAQIARADDRPLTASPRPKIILA
jgi:hypothetical protein